MNKVLKYLKENIYLISLILVLILVLIHMSYRLYKKESFEDIIWTTGEDETDPFHKFNSNNHNFLTKSSSGGRQAIDLKKDEHQNKSVWLNLSKFNKTGEIENNKKIYIITEEKDEELKNNNLEQRRKLKNETLELVGELGDSKKKLSDCKNKGFFDRLFG